MNQFAYPIIGNETEMPVYLIGVGKTEQRHTRFSGFPIYQLLYSAHGDGVLVLDGKKYNIAEKEGFLLFPNIEREYYPKSGYWESHWVTFDGYGAEKILGELKLKNFTQFRLHDLYVFDSILSDMIAYSRAKNYISGYKNSSLLYDLLVELYRVINENPTGERSNKYMQVQAVLNYIDTHFNQSISLEELVKTAQVSPQYLCRLFQDSLKMRPFTYITLRRLQEAKRLLTETDKSVKQIAMDVGYNSASYFCSIFNKYERMTPEYFRNMQKLKRH